jgi:hypothetical protein
MYQRITDAAPGARPEGAPPLALRHQVFVCQFTDEFAGQRGLWSRGTTNVPRP